MDIYELSHGTMDEVHHRAGSSGYEARDAAGARISPAYGGVAQRFSFASGLSISLAEFVNPVSVAETLCPPGRQLSIFLQGGPCQFSVDGAPQCRVMPGQALLCTSGDSYRSRIQAQPDRSYRFVSIGFDGEWANSIVRRPSMSDDPLLRLLDLGADAVFYGATSPSPEVQRLADEYFTRPVVGSCGALIAEGRALQIIAGIAQSFDRAASPPRVERRDPKLTRGDIERLQEAKRLIEEQPEVAFTLPVLARQVGLNVNKLKAGFKLLFGRTVGDHASQVRMAHAHHLLAAEGLQVASVAYRLGYTPTHFAVAFRRYYGVPPSRITR